MSNQKHPSGDGGDQHLRNTTRSGIARRSADGYPHRFDREHQPGALQPPTRIHAPDRHLTVWCRRLVAILPAAEGPR